MNRLQQGCMLAIFTATIPVLSFAQESKMSGWDISFSGGLAIPFGAYRSSNPESSVITSEAGFPIFNGFNKRGNSAALNGHAWNAEVSYTLKSNWAFSLTATSTLNPVETGVVNAYLNDQLDMQNTSRIMVNQDDYQAMFYTLGVRKIKHWKHFYGSMGIDVGLAVMDYPFYDVSIIENSSGNNYPLYHIGFKPVSKSYTMGVNGEVGYRLSRHLSTALQIRYRFADFLYEIGLHPVGGSSSFLFVDTINYRQLLPCLKVCYHF
ncbi:MAG: hypothetical protein KF725_16405 [Cyclobacteriaceae bacterium]|nr:hypothetical protein [Cyclobacteriaceae bacterium]UYN87170.1 MAG: hypothetical protein KIT51_02520 [Cyclobacteriaceae bacterium]